MDVKEGAFPDLDKAAEFVGVLSDMIGTRPSVLIHSGHGLQPLWPIEDGELDTQVQWARAYRLSRRFGRLATSVAGNFSASLDNVSDLTRVLRVPGTTNWKDPKDPAQADAVRDSGGPLTVDRVEEFLDEWAPEIASDEPVVGDTVSSPDTWRFGHATCPYVAKMVRSWNQESDRPSAGRHQWATDRAVRLAVAYRLGCLTEDGLTTALDHLESCLTHWCQTVGDPRDLHYDEIGSAFRWGLEKVATFTEERTRLELGDHQHGDADGVGVTLPESFWKRPALNRIRQAAWSMLASPDAVWGITLAKLSASLPPGVRIDTGVRRPMSLNIFVAPVGKTGGFKSSAMQTAKTAVNLVPSWASNGDVGVLSPLGEDVPYRAYFGSGQGIVENFMGEVEVAEPVPEGGKPKLKKVRQQVRTNVLLSLDEGNGLVKALGDANSIVGETLRELWTGTDSGQGNARTENKRGVREGEYSFGMIVGLQLSVLGKLLGSEDAELGTPQRFLFVWTGAPDIPDGEVPYPGNLVVKIPAEPMTLCPELRNRVRAELLPQLRNGGAEDESDSQRISMLIRLAGLLALLDGDIDTPNDGLVMTVHGRDEITEADWALAETMLNTSRAIRTHAGMEKRRKATRAKQAERASNLAAEVEAEDANSTPEGRMQLRILGYVAEAGGHAKWSGEGRAI